MSDTSDYGLTEARKRIDEARANNGEVLDLSGLQLSTLPDSIGLLRQLRTLNLSNNYFTTLPEVVCKLTTLRSLNLSLNHVTDLTDNIHHLCSLEQLNADNNYLAALSPTIASLKRLQELRVSENRLTELPAALGDCSRLTFLDVHGNKLKELPDAMGQLRALAELNVADNDLTTFPDIGQLTCLVYLDVSNNTLSDIQGVCNLPRLQTLWLLTNHLTVIPPCIRQLSQLARLSLANNRLRAIPSSLGDLQRLRILYLNQNQLTELPDSIGQLHLLEYLSLTNNLLTALPSTLGSLRRLKVLEAAANNIFTLPEELRCISSLETLSIEENPVIAIPHAITSCNSPSHILQYYFETREGQPLDEAKLIFLGYEGVGKTSLINCVILHKQFNREEPPTKGTNITVENFDLDGGRQIKLRIWDFGGQDIYHAMHTFFLTDMAVYVLVINGRKEREVEPEAASWLSLIARYAPQSKIIVVLNKISSSPFNVNRRLLKEKYDNLLEFIETDCEDGRGFAQLHSIIREALQALPEYKFKPSWSRVKERLTAIQEGYISFDRYREICREYGEADHECQERLAKYLRDVGVVINYLDEPWLQDMNILKPEWVIEGINAILSARKVEIGPIDLAEILQPKAYPSEKQVFLLELMRKFEMCFRLSEPEGYYLIPQMLDENEPAEVQRFDPKRCLNFQYNYSTLLSPGLFPAFIARTYVHSAGQLRWRTGVILALENSRALVKSDPVQRCVRIMVDGLEAEGRRKLLAVIRGEFDKLHKNFKVDAEAMVPVREDPNITIRYDDLWYSKGNAGKRCR